MGIQGSGKGTHAKLLAGDFDLEHLAVGDIFRWNVQHHTKRGAQIGRTMAAGLLVGDDLVEGVVGYGSASTTGTTASSSTASPATSGTCSPPR